MKRDDSELVRSELERILASNGFAHNQRLKSFLRFVVEQEIAGLGDQIKESLVGVEVFGRRPDYDVRRDSVVRTEAARLRARLAEYYSNGGANDPLVIELPKGGYKPVFREVASPPEMECRADAPVRFSRRRWLLTGVIAVTVVAALTIALWRIRIQKAPISIAVLPLINLSQDPNSDYFTDGLTGEIIRNLSIIDGLVVRSQTSSFVFKGKPRNIHDAGKQLDAQYIVEGSVFRTGNQLRINAQLVRVRDDFPIWSRRYDRELTDVFVIQDEISRGIVNSLRLKLGGGRRRYETSTEAYDLYLKGRAYEIDSVVGRNENVAWYEQAIARDKSFAPAYAALGAAYAHRTGEDRVNWTGPDRAEEMSRMHTVVEKALQLDPLLAEAHAARGMVLARDGQWKQSEESFRRALELEPNRSLTRTDFVLSILIPLGRLNEAVAQVRLAKQSDPLSPFVESALVYTLFSAGHLTEAASHCGKPGWRPEPMEPCTRALLLQGKTAQAIPLLETQFRERLAASGSYELGYAYALAGRRADAERIASIQPRLIEQAIIFVALGDRERAFEALNRAVPLGPVRIGRALTFPELAPLRGDPRIAALRKKVGLPE